ncbi:MAG: PKD domain-containing protein [Bacteroidia bacterium]
MNVGNNQANILVSDTVLCYGDTAFLSCNSTTGAGITWNLGGSPGAGCDVFFTAYSAGTYLIAMAMVEPGGCVVRDTVKIRVFRPVPHFTGDTLFACDPPLTVQFTNNSTGTQNMTYLWGFGDGVTSTTANPSHTYTAKGEYTVRLLATDSLGCRTGYQQLNYVKIGGASASFSAEPSGGCKPLPVNFIHLAPVGSSHFWDFGDGSTSTSSQPSHTYLDTGIYIVKHILTDPLGCVDSIIDIVTVGDTVHAAFGMSDTVACMDQYVQYTNLSTGNYNTQTWNFSGLGSSGDKHPLYAIGDTGYHYIQLIVSDRGCKDTLRKDSALYVLLPVARAVGNRIGCDTPHTVFFRDSSIGAHRYWWDFGTGNPGDSSTLRDPVFTYRNTGIYPVTHVVWNDSTGCPDTTILTVVVEVFRMQASASPTSGCGPLAVQFQDNTIGSVRWRWNFGDGGTDSIPSPLHTYTAPGVYRANAVFFSGGACADVRQFTINVYGPQALFQVPDTNVCAGQPVQFTDLSPSSLPKVSWLWDFGDGTQSTASNPSHTYTRAGQYTVSLTVTDSRGCASTLRKSRLMYVSAPNANFLPAFPATCMGNPMLFREGSTGQSTLTYAWDFGDGGLSNSDGDQTYTFVQNGTYPVKLTVTDSLGCSDSMIHQVIVQDPDIDIQANKTSINCPPLLVSFTATVRSAHGFASWQWFFGDGNGSAVQNPTHQYVIPGTYQVFLVATTNSGCRDTFFLDSTISVLGPHGSFSFSPFAGCEPFSISGTAQALNTLTNAVDFDDGTVIPGTPILNRFSHTYTRPGIYHPVMILDDGLGCRISVTSPDSVIVYPKPDADFVPSQAVFCDTGSLQYLDRSVSASTITNWLWDFGDGTSSNAQNPVHFYAGPGTYDVQLVVTTTEGCKDTALATGAIQVNPLPQARMRLSGVAGCTPFYLEAFDASPPGAAPIVDWLWDFGLPGASERKQNASFTYLNPGIFTVTLTVRDANGCVSVIDTTIEAWERPVAAFVTRNDSLGCSPFPVSFLDKSFGPVPMAAWNWQFGTGDSSLVQNPNYTYQQDGSYDLRLIVTDARGCDDTLFKNEYIRLKHPVADFDAVPTEGCPPPRFYFLIKAFPTPPLCAGPGTLAMEIPAAEAAFPQLPQHRQVAMYGWKSKTPWDVKTVWKSRN